MEREHVSESYDRFKNCGDRAECDAAWAQLQKEWFSRITAAINDNVRQVRADGDPVVVFLIHGFNNGFEAARVAYGLARERIAERAKTLRQEGHSRSLVFIEVYWDGRRGAPPLFRSWGPAQHTGPLVGLSLRRIVAEIGEKTRVRVLTHSSGAFVIASTMGDASAALPCTRPERVKTPACEGYKRYVDHIHDRKAYPTPEESELRVAMLAPATSPLSFLGTEPNAATQRPGLGVKLPEARIAWSLDRADFALTKAVIPATASWFGATSVGAHCETALSLKQDLVVRKRVAEAHVVSFERAVRNRTVLLFWDSHDFSAYLDRGPANTMIDFLLDKQPMNWPAEPDCIVPLYHPLD